MHRGLVSVGLVGGIFVVVSVFLPLAKMSSMGTTVSMSSWDYTDLGVKLPYVALAGGIIVTVGAALTLVTSSGQWLSLVIIGGVLSLLGVSYGTAMIDMTAIMPAWAGFSAGLGAYLGVIGGIMALISVFALFTTREEKATAPEPSPDIG